MSKEQKPERADRRRFLGRCALIGTASAAVVAVGDLIPTETEAAPVAAPQPPGYRLTEHIRTYYDSVDR